MEDGRIWLTGAGLVTSLGVTREATWERLVRGDRALGPLDLFDASGLVARAFGVVRGFAIPAEDWAARGWSRTSVLAWNAAKEAIEHAGLDVHGKRVGLVVGGTTGGTLENESLLATLHGAPSPARAELAVAPLAGMVSHPLSSTADSLHATLGPFARMATVCSACSSGANALLLAALWLRSGELDAVVAGGTDALCRLTVSGFQALQAIDAGPCRPFDRRRRGLNLGEGAGFAVLERASDARARGAVAIAELAGWASASEGHHITNPEASGATAGRALAAALASAGLTPRDVDYVNAHGTATPLNDPMEAAALARALGSEIDRVPVSSSKGQIGHTLGAAGAIEAVFAALAVARGEIPPTAGLDEPDPAIRLTHVPHVGRRGRVRAALSSSFGFGGMDTVVAFREPTGASRPPPPRRPVVITGAASLAAEGGPLSIDASAALDVARARRMDRPARLAAIVASRALDEAATTGGGVDRARTAVVLGTAFGSVDPTAAFMHRLLAKGPRFASPAEFPNLVPSSPVGHVSIYAGLHGAAIATADLATGGECAVRIAADLVASGEADAAVAGAVEEASVIVDHVFRVLFERSAPSTRPPVGRGEGAGVLVLEAEDRAVARGARVLARLVDSAQWHAPSGGRSCREAGALAGPEDADARVVLVSEDDEVLSALGASRWASVPRAPMLEHAGGHEARGALSLVMATSLIARGEASSVLVLGMSKGRSYGFVLAGPRHA